MSDGALGGVLRRCTGSAVRLAVRHLAAAAAIGRDDRAARRFGSFGVGACLTFPQGSIFNERAIRIGRDTIVGPRVSLTAGMAEGQELISNPIITIGDRCVIGRGSHIVGHWNIEIGNDVQTGPYVYITDQNHSYLDPRRAIGEQMPVEAAVRIGSGSWLGTNVVVLPGTTIGENVVVAASAVVRGEVPARCVVAGVPARIVKRFVEGLGWMAVDEEIRS